MKKKVFTLLAVMLVVTFLAGCSMQDELLIKKMDSEETYPEVPGQLEKVYSGMEAIAADADLIAQVSVIEQAVEILDGYPQTHTNVKVTEVYKGLANMGDKLEVVEEGGYEGRVMGGLPQLDESNDYILFLTEYNGGYHICGAFQGRFIERAGYMFQQATEDTKLRNYTPVSVADFVSSLAEMTADSDTAKEQGFGKKEQRYRAQRAEGLYFDEDYDTVVAICDDACSAFFAAIRQDAGVDFSPYIDNAPLLEYMEYKVKYHPFRYSGEARLCVTEVDFEDEYVLVKGRPVVKSESSSGSYGEISFLVANENGRVVIADWYWNAKDSFDQLYRGEFSPENNIGYWSTPQKYLPVLEFLRDGDRQVF